MTQSIRQWHKRLNDLNYANSSIIYAVAEQDINEAV